MSGVFANLSPALQDKQVIHSLQKQDEMYKKQASAVRKETDTGNLLKDTEERIKTSAALGIREKQAEVGKQLAEHGAIPQQAAAERIRQAGYEKDIAKALENKKARVVPFTKGQVKAAQQVQQKMSFDDFKNQLTVKDLPKPMQEKAYNEYTATNK